MPCLFSLMNNSNEYTLKEYLLAELAIENETLESALSDFFSDSAEYIGFLTSTKIIVEHNKVRQDLAIPHCPFVDYLDVVDSIVELVFKRDGFHNVLTFGYHYGDDSHTVTNHLFTSNINFNINHLKGKVWKQLYYKIGLNSFLKIIGHTSCFIKLPNGNFFQLFGRLGTVSAQLKQRELNIVCINNVLYHDQFNFRYIFPLDLNLLLASIFRKNGPFGNKKWNLTIIRKLLSDIQKNHLNCPYLKIYLSVISNSDPEVDDHLQRSTEISQVIRFVIIVFGKLFPLKIWGSKENRAYICSRIANFLQLSKNDTLDIKYIVNKLKLSDISWLGKSSKITSLQDFTKRKQILHMFVLWFFEHFLVNLIQSFWYVTESSRGNGINLLFYSHEVWKSMVAPWLKNYQLNNLRDVTSSCKTHCKNKLKGNLYFHGNIRLIPKSKDFRLLCIPQKSNITEYNYHFYNYIQPVRALLRERLIEKATNSRYPFCRSTVDVIKKLQGFLKQCKLKHQKRLYVVKFDMKQCYDMLNRRGMMKIVEKLLNIDTIDSNTKSYYFRELNVSTNIDSKFRNQLIQIRDQANLRKLNVFESSQGQPSHSSSFIDKRSTKILSQFEIIKVIEYEAFKSAAVIKNVATSTVSCFGRQRGLFQGFPLLGILSEIVYSDLVETYFNFLSPEDNIVLRLADDFMIISTVPDQSEKVCNLIHHGFDSTHGAIINTEKTVTINIDETSNGAEVVSFTGIRFNPNTLEIDRTDGDLKMNAKYLRSFAAFYEFYISYLKRKLNDSVFDFEVETFAAILLNVEKLLREIFSSVCSNIKHVAKVDKFDEDKTLEFYLSVVLLVVDTLAVGIESIENATEVIVHTLKESSERSKQLLGIVDKIIQIVSVLNK